MVLYVAFVAILNLALGFALAVYLGVGGRRGILVRDVVVEKASYLERRDAKERESDEAYDEHAENREYQTAVR